MTDSYSCPRPRGCLCSMRQQDDPTLASRVAPRGTGVICPTAHRFQSGHPSLPTQPGSCSTLDLSSYEPRAGHSPSFLMYAMGNRTDRPAQV